MKNGSTKRIHDTNLLKKALQIESAIQIFKVRIRESGFGSPPAWIHKHSFRAIVLRIRQGSWGFVGFVKTGRIFGSSGHETNPQFESFRIGLANPDSRICYVRIRDYDTKQIFLESGFVTTIRYETNPWICKTNPRFNESLIPFPHPYLLDNETNWRWCFPVPSVQF